ncbi:MAG TPA: hypothetical protein VL947_11635 [Cytophagales bacterium]|nr:hypothetical protein [Cytophagales bacterium]
MNKDRICLPHRIHLEYAFIGFMALLTILLFMSVTMDKNSYYALDSHPVYDSLIILIIVFIALLNQIYMQYKIWFNGVGTIICFKVSCWSTQKIFFIYHPPLNKFFAKGLPQYWYFNVKWFELLVISIMMLLLCELFYVFCKSFFTYGIRK